MHLSIINCDDLAFSGFGDTEARLAIGYVWNRNTTAEEVPLAFYIQTMEGQPTVGVYFGLLEQEPDSTDHNIFRQYTICQPKNDDVNDPTLWALQMLDTLYQTLKISMTVAQLDRCLVCVHNAVRAI